MKQRKLGHSRFDVSNVGLGCMTMTGLYDAADDDESIATIQEAIDRGMNFIDSSDAYGAGGNEELVGKAIAERRDKVILGTKFGNVRKDGKPGAEGRPEYVFEACEKSLKRLGVDVIDLYYQHRVDPDVPIEETIGAMARLVEQGKVISLGMSEAAEETLRRGHATHPISALQTEYSLFCRFAEEDLLPACKELGVTFVAYSPLGRGFLTGAVRELNDMSEKDRRRDHPRFTADNIAHNVAMLGPIKKIAVSHDATLAQVAIGWLLAKGDYILPIPGTKSRNHLNDNIAAGDIVLSESEVAALDSAVPVGFTAGDRYPPGGMKTVNI